MKQLSHDELIQLQEALAYLHVEELKVQLEQLQLSPRGFNKHELICRLMHYATTGQELPPLQIPTVSKAVRGIVYPLTPNTRMLYGTYKNDLATRNFFKQLIGPHFNFTAQGIDWLREQWLAGNPPTYAEFTQEWQAEYERNKKEKRPPKQEWAYIRFVQRYMEQCLTASKKEVLNAWNEKRQEYVQAVHTIFKKIK
ncbi:MAG TPA: hypothetical protein VGT41_00855 [Candidatus Babeliales bacterium]|nr:hypothetical protein [Candidatus Babeliales bacterium]